MPNLVTVAGTGIVGPGNTQPSKQFNDVINLNVDFVEQVLTLFRSGGQSPITLDYNVFTTVSWTISAHLATVSFS
jgi:hypothetical protein